MKIPVAKPRALLADKGYDGDRFRESLLIGGWVAMWRPMEIFLYDWWPVAARIRLLRRLSGLKVTVRMSNADQATI